MPSFSLFLAWFALRAADQPLQHQLDNTRPAAPRTPSLRLWMPTLRGPKSLMRYEYTAEISCQPTFRYLEGIMTEARVLRATRGQTDSCEKKQTCCACAVSFSGSRTWRGVEGGRCRCAASGSGRAAVTVTAFQQLRALLQHVGRKNDAHARISRDSVGDFQAFCRNAWERKSSVCEHPLPFCVGGWLWNSR